MSNSLAYDIYNEGGLLNGRYQKLENIAEGAYGYVSLAKDLNKGRLVAVKYIYPMPEDVNDTKNNVGPAQATGRSKSMVNYSTTESVCEEAKHEIKIHEQLGDHPNIISCVDYFDSFIILEYCSRGDLYEAIQSNTGPQTTRDIINVALQLIEAVDYAHKRGIYHRDIKPENVLISSNGSIRLSDWGLATTERYCDDFGVGSQRYMAPELFDEGNITTYDASKCDIWSIGIVLLNIVFRKNPFNVANQTDKSFAYFASNREALFDIFSSMSNDLFTALRHCLTLDPNNRDLNKLKEELLKVQSLTIDDDIEIWTKEEAERQQQLAAKEAEEKVKAAQRKAKAISPDPISQRIPQNIKVSYVNNNSHYVRRNHYDPLMNHRRHIPLPRAEPYNKSSQGKQQTGATPSRFIPISNNINNNHDKSFDVHTPNTHINNHFQNFRKEMFNRKDYFTPPSVSAHYMEKFDQERKRNRRQSYADEHSSGNRTRPNSNNNNNNNSNGGKYLPPFKQRLSHSKPTTSTSNQIVSPSSSYYSSSMTTAKNSLSTINPQRKTSSFSSGKYIPPSLRVKYQEEGHQHYEAILSDDEEDTHAVESDDDGELFVLDDPSLTSSFTKLEITKSTDEEDLIDSDVSTAPSTSGSSHSPSTAMGLTKTSPIDMNPPKSLEKTVYIPPHHRGNFNQTLDKNSFRNFQNGFRGGNGSGKPPKRRHSTNTHSIPQTSFAQNARFRQMYNNVVVEEDEEEEESDLGNYGRYDHATAHKMTSSDSGSSNDSDEIYSQVSTKQKVGDGAVVNERTRVLNYV